MNELRQLFESSYPGKEVIFEKLIKPIFPKAEDTIKSTSLELGENEKDKIESFHIFAQQSGAFEITFADIELKPYINLKRNRVTIQNCIRRVLNNHSNALIFFHHADNPDEWRFSYVYRETSNKTSTSAKRYTYLCGKNHACRTVAQRFKELAKNKITDESLLRAFSVEALTKEFFAELFAWYEWACEVAKFPGENSKGADVELTKDKNNLQLIRLITRIIFVWFIKHKDLIPTWLFNKNELEQILADCDLNSLDKGNYYNAILQNLFFATLNKKIEERSFANNSNGEKNDNHYGIKTLFRDDNKESFFKIEQNEIIEKFKSVPFLNGGLFECLDCDENDDNNTKHIVRYIDGFSREKERRAFVPNELFWNDEKGLINILNRYNFTVEENTPTDVQVALDPELLGKVFENLLGTYNPETHESARKDSGSFYTPREIVSYMVNSSIKSHLQSKVPDVSEENLERLTNDDKSDDVDIELTQEQIEKIQKALFEIKIIDPACGSGAFPMGILNKLVNIHILLNNLSAKKDTQTNLTIKKGQCINYTPRNSELEIKAEYLGNKNFTLEVNGEKDTLIYDSQKLALHVKEVINQYNKQHDKKTIANLFSQGRIDDNETFNTIKSKREIKRIVDEDTNEIIWQYKTYNVENKFRQYRKDEQTTISDNANEEEDYEHAKDLYNLKLKIIEESIFGVDIQPIAIQICKLRFFISLICEQEKENKPEENYGYPPLPNLETKFVAANSLIGLVKKDTKKEVFNLFNEVDDIKNKLQELRHKHFKVNNVEEKIKIRKDDDECRKKLVYMLSKEGEYYAPKDAIQLANWNPYDQNAVSDFFDPDWMFGVKDGFDIVIGNPPYIQLQKDSGKLATLYESQKYKTYAKTGDVYCLFYEQGFNLLKQKSHLCFITSNKWMRAGYGEKLRKFLAENTNPKLLIDFAGVKVFESATVDTNILLFEKANNKGKTNACQTKNLTVNDLLNLSDFVRQQSVECSFEYSDSWVILSPVEQSIKRKIESIGTPLKDWDIQINYGIKTGFNDAFIINTEKRNEILDNCSSEGERKKTDELIRPILRGRDIKHYGYNWADLWLIATFPSRHYDIEMYPAVKKYLLSFGIERLEQTGKTHVINGEKIKARKKTSNKWFETQDSISYWEDFSQPRIIYREIGSEMDACMVDKGWMINNKLYMISGKHLDHLLNFLNSKLFNRIILSSTNLTGGKGVDFMEKIIVPLPEQCDLSSADDNSTPIRLYRLYNLTANEIEFIENQ